MKLHLGIAAAVVAGSLALPAIAHAQTTIDWDDLPNGSYMPTPLGYQGFNFFYGDGTFGTGNLLQYSTLDGRCNTAPNCAYNALNYNPIRIESLTPDATDEFTFSALLSGGYPNFGPGPVAALLQGFVGASSTPLFSQIIAIPNDDSWVQADVSAYSINKLLISPVDANGNAATGFLLLDSGVANAPTTVATTPEPASFVLTGTGIGIAALVRRRRNRRTRTG